MYWDDDNRDVIQRGNMNGSGSVETILNNANGGISNPVGIAIDLVNGRIYWTDSNANALRSATLDGQDIEDYLVFTSGLYGLALYQPQEVVVIPGDCDGSGAVNLGDVPCFVNALLGTDTNPPGGIERSDVNGDEATNSLDIQLFVDLLIP